MYILIIGGLEKKYTDLIEINICSIFLRYLL